MDAHYFNLFLMYSKVCNPPSTINETNIKQDTDKKWRCVPLLFPQVLTFTSFTKLIVCRVLGVPNNTDEKNCKNHFFNKMKCIFNLYNILNYYLYIICNYIATYRSSFGKF